MNSSQMDSVIDLMNENQRLKDLNTECIEALKANQIFHTPLALCRNGQLWDEYQIDAINRTRDILSKTV